MVIPTKPRQTKPKQIKPQVSGKKRARMKRARLGKALENRAASNQPAFLKKIPLKKKAWRSFSDKFMLYTGETLHWTQIVSRLSNTVIHAIAPWVLLCVVYSVGIALSHHLGYFHSVTEALPQAAIALNLVLSLLLVFRTSVAHDRFWEARKLWGALVNTSRNLSRSLWLTIEEPAGVGDRSQKEATMRLVSSFAVAVKLHLRREPMGCDHELASLMSPLQYNHIQHTQHGPLELAFWIGDYLQYQYESGRLNVLQLQDLQGMLNKMVDILGGCERILKTPIPLPYTIAIRFLFAAYFLVVPLGIIDSLGWGVVPVMLFTSFVFLSIHEISCEIEEPFGRHANDLPLDFICNTIKANIDNLIQEGSSSRSQVNWPERVAH